MTADAKDRSMLSAQSHGVASSGLSVNAAGRGIQRRIQRQGSVPVVFESVALGATRRKRQHRIESIQRLNGSLHTGTEHGGKLWRVQVPPDNVSDLGFEIRIVAGHVAFQAVRPLSTPDCTASLLTPSAAASLRQLQ
jgi:hypothetical protein